MKSDLVDLTVELVHETGAAVLVRLDEDAEKIWLPKSQIEIHRDDPIPGVATITMPERHGIKVEPALDLLENVHLSPQVLPLSHVVCTVRLGQPRRADLLASELGIDLANDSDRSAAFNFAWPMLAVEPLMPPVPARGAQGFWEIAL